MNLDRNRHVEFEELISASLHGDLTSEERRRLDAHLDGCAACRDTLAAFAEQRRIMAGLRHVAPPRDLGARVRAGIESGAARRRWWQRPPAIFAGVAGSLAVVAGALLALVLLDRPAEDPQVGRTSPTPSVAVATASPAEETLAPLETPLPATPIPTLPPASQAPDATPEPVPTVAPAQETPEPEVFLAVASPSENEAAMTLRTTDDSSETATTLAAVEPPEETSAADTAVPIAAELSPDGQWLAYIVDMGPSGLSEIHATRVAAADPSEDPDGEPPVESDVAVGETLLLAESVSGSPFVEHLFWSPDSAHLAFTAVDREGGGTDAWIFDPATGEAAPLTDTGTAYAGSWATDEDGTPMLWVSTAAGSPESHLLPIPEPTVEGGIEPVDPSEGAVAATDGFQPIVSPNGALVIYWAGQMQQQDGGEWAFTIGGAPWLAENREDEEQGRPFSNAREVFRDVTIRQNAFGSAAVRWAPDSDTYVIWNAAWQGETQSGDGQYPDVRRVYLTRASDPRGMTRDHAIDEADVPEESSVVDVKVAGTGRHLAITARKPTPGDLAAPEAELFLITRNTGDVADETETLGSEPEVWFGPAVFTPEQWADVIGE